jgi:hypothetical protein
MWSFLQLVVFCHLSKAIERFIVACLHCHKFLSFATKSVAIYFQISSFANAIMDELIKKLLTLIKLLNLKKKRIIINLRT